MHHIFDFQVQRRPIRLVAGSVVAALMAGGLFLVHPIAQAPPPTPPDDVFKVCPLSQTPPSSDFTIRQRWSSTGTQAVNYQTPLVGDLFGTGQPVIVIGSNTNRTGGAPNTDRLAQNLNIYRGLDGVLLDTIVTPVYSWSGNAAMALGDVNGDGQGEVILKVAGHTAPVAVRGRLIAYNNDGSVLWTSDQRYDYGQSRGGLGLNLADFNGDGVPETYVGSQVFNAQTGARLASLTAADSTGCPDATCFWGNTAAVDMDGDGVLELVAGNVVYKVNISNPAGEAGNSLTVWQQADSSVPNVRDGWTAVADIDLDGDPDVVVTHATPAAFVYVWEGESPTVMGSNAPGDTNGGQPFVGDIDGDGAPEIVFVTTNNLRAYDFVSGTGLVSKWTLTTSDGSGLTGLTIFDFNNDGVMEIVYRDEVNIRIMNGAGSSATDLATFACSSGTATEMPLVADIDGSREARIVTACSDGNGIDGDVRVFSTNSFPWANTRPVWNQQAYYVTHVSNDLTIPAQQFPHWTSFSDPGMTCSTGTNRPLNAFLQQVTDLNPSTGCPVACGQAKFPTCDARGMLFQSPGAGGPTNVQAIDLVTGAFDLLTAPIAGRQVNAVGYNVLDDYIYGWDLQTGVMVRVGGDGSVVELGVPLGHVGGTSVVGEVDENGQYWFLIGANWYRVDLAPGSATYMQLVDSGTAAGVTGTGGADWAYVPGGGNYLYRVMGEGGQSQLWRFDRTGHTWGYVGALGVLGDNVFGATYADAAGFLYVSSNALGSIYRIDVQAVTGGIFAAGPTSSGNDGTRCFNAPIRIDFGDAADTFGTTLAVDGARHGLPIYDAAAQTAPLMLGARVAPEEQGQPDANAALDLFDDGAAVGSVVLTAGSTTATATLTAVNATASDATLAGWIDFNSSGTFEAGERAAATVPAGTVAGTPFMLTWNGLSPIPPGFNAIGRFRLANDAAQVANPIGAASNGEVEDYIVPIRPSAVLVITKSSSPKPAVPGRTLTYTITATNQGPSAATDMRVQDAVPAVLGAFTWTCVQPSGACSPASGTGAIDTLVDLAAGTSATITLTGTLPSNHVDPITNTATLTPPPGIESLCPLDNPTCHEAPDTNDPEPLADLTMAKTGPPSILRGGTATYVLAVTNAGPSDVAAATLNDPTPPGLTFTSASAPCEGGFPCALGPIAAGATTQVTVAFSVPGDYAGPMPVVNTATVTSPTPDPVPENNTTTVTTPFVESADLQVTKTVDNEAPSVGGTVRFTITVLNAGPANAGNIALIDQLPSGVTFVSAAPSQGTYGPPTGRWAIGSLANGASATLTIDATVTSSGPQANLATITETDTFDPDTSNNSAGSAINVPTAADLQVHKVADLATVGVGSNVTFTITVRNAGPDTAPAVEILEPLSAGLTFVSATPSVGSYSPATGIWTVGALANGAEATLQLTATVTAAETIVNTARVTGNQPFDPAPPNNESGTTINGIGADLQVVKTADRATTAVGDRVTFTIVVFNNGPGQATGVQVRESLPAGLTYVSSSASQGAYVPGTGLWSVGTLTPPTGGASTATLTVVADVTAAGVHRNVATIAAQDQPDPTPGNDGSGVDVESVIVDLEAGLTFIGDADAVGRLFDFFVTVTNRGSQPTPHPLIVAIPFPREVSFTAPQTTWPCEAVGRTLFCEHALDAPLPPEVGRLLTYWAEVAQVFPRGLAAYAHTVSPFDDNVRNNVGGALLTPPAHDTANLQVTQTIVTNAAGPGGTVVYRVEVTNLGPSPATDVTLVDALPAGLTLSSIQTDAGSCAGTQRIACVLGTLAPQQRATLTISAQTTGNGLIGHTVSVSGREVDPDLTNNAARTTFALAPAFNPALDTDGDGMTDVWESTMGLDPAGNDASGDPDGDGVTNAQEAAAGTHPRGFYKQYFAEGVTNGFFDTAFDLLNVDASREAAVLCALMADTGEVTALPMRLGPVHRHTGEAYEMLSGREGAFAAVIESDRPLATDRLTTWDKRGYGSALEGGLSAPSDRWFFAEGATNIFGLFYLLQNPSMTTPAEVTIRYLLASGAPVTQTYTVPAHSRLTIPVNEVPGLASADVSAEIMASQPIVAERAMYLTSAAAVFDAGHVGAGATSTSASWFFAEGATGSFFDLYLLLANPNASPTDVTVQYQLPDGRVVAKTHTVAANARHTINVRDEDAALAATSVAMAVTATQPIVAERSMWWPVGAWQEAHVVLGATTTGTRWALAGGMVGGPRGESFYALIANQAATTGQARVTAVFDDGSRQVQVIDLPPTSRTTVDVSATFPDSAGRRLSLLIESVGSAPVPLVVEGSRYSSADGRLWSAGGAMLGTRLP